MRVNVTGQPYDYVRPWQKRAPFSKRALGAVLPQGRVLVTADLVANQNYVELERAESGEKTAPTSWSSITKRTWRCSSRPIRRFLNGSRHFSLRSTRWSAIGSRLGSSNRPARRWHRRTRDHDPDDPLPGRSRSNFLLIASAFRCSTAITATPSRSSRITSSPVCSFGSIRARRCSTLSRRRSSRIS